MPDSNKSTTAVIRALLDEMVKALAAPKPVQPAAPGRRRTRVNVKEFNKAQDEGESWWKDGGDEDPFIGLRPRPKRRGPRR